jgi:hypothetical protein
MMATVDSTAENQRPTSLDELHKLAEFDGIWNATDASG